MADEVTKKDLQSLQGYCNKQIAEVAKKAEGLVKELAEEFKAYKETKEKYELSSLKADNKVNEMRLKSEGDLAAAIAALEARVTALEKNKF